MARAEKGRPIIMLLSDPRVAMIEKRAREIRMITCIYRGSRCARGPKQMRRNVDPDCLTSDFGDEGTEVFGRQPAP